MFLTGSRFFGGARPDSDWDYVAQDSPAARAQLDDLGYRLAQDTPSRFCRQVWERNSVFGTVQIKLVADERAAWWMQSWLFRHYRDAMRSGSPLEKRRLWDGAYRTYLMQERAMNWSKVGKVTVEVGKWGWRLLRLLNTARVIKVKEIDKVGPAVDAIVEGK